MDEFLNYFGRPVGGHNRTALGLASSCVGAVVIAIPITVCGLAAIFQHCLRSFDRFPLAQTICSGLMLLPLSLMIALPIIGVLLGMLGVTLGKRACQYAIIGLFVNIAVLVATLFRSF